MSSGMLKRKLIGEVEIREAAGDVFHDFFQNRPHHIPTVSPDIIQSCNLHDGEFGKVGSTISWNYTVEGKQQTIKEILEVVDEKNKMMKFHCIEGDRMKDYKTIDITFEVIPKDKETSIVRWTLEYEKMEEGYPEPTAEMDALVKLAIHIDDHHHTQANKNV